MINIAQVENDYRNKENYIPLICSTWREREADSSRQNTTSNVATWEQRSARVRSGVIFEVIQATDLADLRPQKMMAGNQNQPSTRLL